MLMRSGLRRRTTTGRVLLAAALGVLPAGRAAADAVISGCYNVRQGTLRIVEAGIPCQKGETLIQWNQSGPAGPPGPQGPRGDPGPAGAGPTRLEDIQGLPCSSGAEAGAVAMAINPFSHGISLACPPVSQMQLFVAVEGAGTIRSTPPGVVCGSGLEDCSHSYPTGGLVTLVESHDAGQAGFLGWGPPCNDSAPTCQVTMDQARLVTARFQPILTVKLQTFASSRQFNCILSICVHVDVFTESRARIRVIDAETSAEIGACRSNLDATMVVEQSAPPSSTITSCGIAVPFGRRIELHADDGSMLGGTQTFVQWGDPCAGETDPICTPSDGIAVHGEAAALFH